MAIINISNNFGIERENTLPEHLYNVGSGNEISIEQLANMVLTINRHSGTISWDSTKPDGTHIKLMDSNKFNDQGWNAKISLEKGILEKYNWF
jgi:GDP-L-fucose synthase